MFEVIAGLFGLLIGSFLNVCIHRWPRDLSVVKPRSRCTQCEHQIAWYDNIPLFSYAALRGRCRYCATAIHWRYPFVELLTALSFASFVAQYGLTLTAVKFCVFAALLIGCTFADLETLILPDEFTIGGFFIGLSFAPFVRLPGLFFSSSLAEAALGGLFPALTLWLLGWIFEKVRHKEGMGFGDVKMIAMVGAFLGLQGALFTIIAGSLLGSVIGIAWIKLSKQDAATYQLPFGSFLGVGALVAAFMAGRS